MIMYCPLMSYRRERNMEVPCIKEDCAWWNKEDKECIVKTFMTPKSPIISQPDYQAAVTSVWYDPEENDIIEDEDDWTLTTTNILGNYGIDKL